MTTALFFEYNDLIGFLQAQVNPIHVDPWLFVYIPETVNYAVRELFADILQPDEAIKADKEESNLDYDSRMSAALERFTQSDRFNKYRFASGHFKVFQIDEVSSLSKSRLMTIIRDPVNRLLADFAAQNGNKCNHLTVMGFLDFAKRVENQNVLLQYLCPKRMWKPKECIDFIQSRFDFIGIAEDLPMTIKMFYAIHGARFHGAPLAQKENGKMLTREDMSPELIKTVSHLNALDYEIFRYFHDRFVKLKEAYFAISDGEVFRKLTYR